MDGKASQNKVPDLITIASWKETRLNSAQGQPKTAWKPSPVALGIKIGSKQLRNSAENALEEVQFPLHALAMFVIFHALSVPPSLTAASKYCKGLAEMP